MSITIAFSLLNVAYEVVDKKTVERALSSLLKEVHRDDIAVLDVENLNPQPTPQPTFVPTVAATELSTESEPVSTTRKERKMTSIKALQKLRVLFEANELSVTVKLGTRIGNGKYDLHLNAPAAYARLSDQINQVFTGGNFSQELRFMANKFNVTAMKLADTSKIVNISDTFEISIVHSAQPTSIPTSMPTCGDGSYVASDGEREVGRPTICGPCPPGSFSNTPPGTLL